LSSTKPAANDVRHSSFEDAWHFIFLIKCHYSVYVFGLKMGQHRESKHVVVSCEVCTVITFC
jgi:hypothetical protein